MNNPSLDSIVDYVLTELKSYDGLGRLQSWIVSADGSSRAIYEHGSIAFDKTGKRVESTTYLNLPHSTEVR